MNRKKLRVILSITFIFYSVFLCYFLFFSDYYGRSINCFDSGYFKAFKEYVYQNINLIPFATISLYIKGYLSGVVTIYPLAVNVIGNFIAFMPLGFFVPYFFKTFRKQFYFLIFIIALIILVELLQLIFMTGVCDIDDLILNVSGAQCIYIITVIVSRNSN